MATFDDPYSLAMYNRGMENRARSTSPTSPQQSFSQLKDLWEVQTKEQLRRRHRFNVRPLSVHVPPSYSSGAYNGYQHHSPNVSANRQRARRHSDHQYNDTVGEPHSYRSRVLDTTFSPLQPAPSSPGMCNQNDYTNYRPQHPSPQASSNPMAPPAPPGVDYNQPSHYSPHHHHQQQNQPTQQNHHHHAQYPNYIRQPQPATAPLAVGTHHSPAGVDYSQGTNYSPRRGQAPPTSMLSRVQRSLNESLWTPEYGDVDHPVRSVGELKQVYGQGIGGFVNLRPARPRTNIAACNNIKDTQAPSQPRGSQQQPPKMRSVGAGKPVWRKPDPESVLQGPPSLTEPGWAPKSFYSPKPGQARSHGGGGQHHPVARHAPAPQPTYPPPGWSHVNAPEHGGGYDISSRSKPAPAHPPQQSYLEIQNRPVPPPVNRSQDDHDMYRDDRPPWAGSLQSSGGPKPWEVQAAAQGLHGEPGWSPAQNGHHGQRHRADAPSHLHDVQPHQPKVQNMHYGPGGGHEYQQHNPNTYGPSDSAKVTHQQYNTPIGLYSRDNVQAMLDGQTKGKPGEGTMRVEGLGTGKTLDLEKSDVYRLIHEQEERRGGGGRGGGHQHAMAAPQQQSARYTDHGPGGEMEYHGYMNHHKQSRSMHILEHQMEQDQQYGTSDF